MSGSLTWHSGGPQAEENTTGVIGVLELDGSDLRNLMPTGILAPGYPFAMALINGRVEISQTLPLSFEQFPTVATTLYFTAEQEVSPGDWQPFMGAFDFDVAILDVNEAPQLNYSSGNYTLSEGDRGVIEAIQVIVASDPDGDAVTYTLTGADAEMFELINGRLAVRADASPDFETDPTLEVNVVATDPDGLSDVYNVIIDLHDHVESAQELTAYLGNKVHFHDEIVAGFHEGMPILSDADTQWMSLPLGTQTVRIADGTIAFGAADVAVAARQAIWALNTVQGISGQNLQQALPDGYYRGLTYEMMSQGATLAEAAMAVIESSRVLVGLPASLNPLMPEFGTEQSFVTSLYNHLFLHGGDPEGNQFWLDQLSSGAVSRFDVLMGFLTSDEFVDITTQNTAAPHVHWMPGLTVYRMMGLYDVAFDRGADAPGFDFWHGKLQEGWSLDALGELFVLSDEFIALDAQFTDADLVDRFYMNAFARHAEQEGMDFWLDTLAEGGWGDVLVGFASSDEFAWVEASYLNGNGFEWD